MIRQNREFVLEDQFKTILHLQYGFFLTFRVHLMVRIGRQDMIH